MTWIFHCSIRLWSSIPSQHLCSVLSSPVPVSCMGHYSLLCGGLDAHPSRSCLVGRVCRNKKSGWKGVLELLGAPCQRCQLSQGTGSFWVLLIGGRNLSGTREYNPGLSPESGSDPLPCCSGITVVVLQKLSEWTAREEVGLFFFSSCMPSGKGMALKSWQFL